MTESVANGPIPSEKSSQKSSTEFFGKLKPFLEKGIDIYTQLSPYINKVIETVQEIWKVISPYYYKYQVYEYGYLALGIVLLFFGGQFNMTIACFTAVKISGLSLIKTSWHQIKTNYINAMEAAHRDENTLKYFDRDGDGKISAEEVTHVAKVFFKGDANTKMEIFSNLRAVFIAIDPQQVMTGLIGIWTAVLTVLATLRSAFAKDVALGVSIGEILSKNISQYIKGFLSTSKDENSKKWTDFGIDLFFKMIGISIALMLVRITSCFHSAVRGAYIVTYHIFQFLFHQQLLPSTMMNANSSATTSNAQPNNISSSFSPPPEMVHIESNSFFIIIQYTMAVYGFWWQASSGFVLSSWILRLLLLPFTINEYILSWVAAY